MSATVSQIAEALGDVLDQAGFRYLPYLGDSVNPPVALIGTGAVTYHGAFGVNGLATHEFTVFLILPRVNDRSGLNWLNDLMSNTTDPNNTDPAHQSMRQMLEGSDNTLGGLVAGLKVISAGEPTNLSINGAIYLSCQFKLEVYSE
jgi:hypothetical protein